MRITTTFLTLITIALLFVSVAAIVVPNAQATTGTLTINSTTVLTEDHYGSIVIAAEGITLDCNGFQVIGSGTGDGIILFGLTARHNVTIKDCRVTGFYRGIYLRNSEHGVLTNNVAYNNSGDGIYLIYSVNNVLTNNTASNNAGRGIDLGPSHYNTLTNNVASNNGGSGIFIVGKNNTLTGNTISNNDVGIELFGTQLWPSRNNTIYHNNFIDNHIQAIVEDGGGNLFNLQAPIGGNYWSNYDTATEGCIDTSPEDGFCDSPYVFTGGNDSLPWTRMNGWVAPMIKDLVNQVKGLHLPAGTENELVSILNNAKESFDKGNNGAAVNQLQAFINKVEAQSGKNIPKGDANTLIANAEAIIKQLED